MGNPALEPTEDRLTFEGLDHVLKASDLGDDLSWGDDMATGDPPGDMWVLDDAIKFLGFTKRTILRKLKTGALRGYKVPGPYGQEWRIYPSDKFDDSSSPDPSPGDNRRSPGANTDLIDELKRQISELKTESQSLQKNLQAATWRNGYLESQVKSQETQIKLLTDGQYKHGLWQRFQSWILNK